MSDCTNCTNWRLKEAGRMAKQGFGLCAIGPRWTYVAKGCDKSKPAKPEVVAARMAWLAKTHPAALAPQSANRGSK